MSFFKDFKSDISQAMNELMPDGNEVFEDETPKAKKKSMNPLSKNLNNDLGLDDKTLSDVDIPNLDDIAPEDMLDQIDDLLDSELYSDAKTPELLLDDEMEVNTMDMSVDDLLSQLSEKQAANITDGGYDGASIEEHEAVKDREEIVNDELNADVVNDIVADENQDVDSTQDTVLEDAGTNTVEDNSINESPSSGNESDMSLEDMLAEVAAEQTENEETSEDTDAHVDIDNSNETVDDKEVDDESTDNGLEEALNKSADTSENSQMNEEFSKDNSIDETIIDTTDSDDEKEEESVEDKDVISINSTDEKNEKSEKTVSSKSSSERTYNINEADTETTYITKGTNIKGDLDTDGSIDIIGTVDGNVTCQGKVVVGGTVKGNITAGELYANGARIEGDVKSYGSVKVGVGSMIIGGIEGESAVIAGAVNGEIDVKGPVIVDSTAVIMGNIKSRSVQINNGAVIEGFCSQSYSDIDVKSFFA